MLATNIAEQAPDLRAAEAFLKRLDPTATTWTFQTFDDNADRKDRKLARTFHGTLEQHSRTLWNLQREGAGVFITVQETDGRARKNENVTRVRAHWLDLDGAPLDPVVAWEPPHILVSSSPGKWQPYWLVTGEALADFERIQITLNTAFDGDDVKDLARVLRLPGFFHQKVCKKKGLTGKLHKVHETDLGTFPEPFTAAMFRDRVARLEKPKAKTFFNFDAGEPVFPAGKRSAAEVEEALTYIPCSMLSYHEWFTVLAAIHSEFPGSDGEGMVERWSAMDAGRFRPGEVAHKWKTVGSYKGQRATIGTVMHLARQNGCDLSGLAMKHGTGGPKREKRAEQSQTKVDEKNNAPADDELVTEDAVALLFTKKHGDTMRFDHDTGRWFEWQDDHWQMDGTSRAFSYCRALAREASNAWDARTRQGARKAGFAGGVERMARSDPAHAVTHKAWDADPWLLGCPGKTIDLRTGQGRQPDPGDMVTKRAAVAPAAGGCPKWLAFLDEATGGDAGMIDFLQRWCGYSLTGDTREHALIFLYGPGGNGKSVFLNTITQILGDYATTASMDTFTASKHSPHLTFLAMLRGARLVTASETEEGRAWAETKIKQMTGGDPITANFMRQDAFTFIPEFKLTIVGNHQPVLHNVDEAARRRFNIVPFVHQPATPDRQLEAKLRAEWPAILQWMLNGCLKWQSDGLTRPKSVQAATDTYFDDQDTFGQWLEECCRVEPGNEHLVCAPADLFKSWSDYAKAAGVEPGTQTALGNNLRKKGLTNTRRRIQGKLARFWAGIDVEQKNGFQPHV